MANTYQFRMISPNETLYEGEILSLVAPGEMGYLGVWAHHAPMLASLGPGKLTIRDKDENMKTFNLASGILEVSREETVVLTDQAEPAAS